METDIPNILANVKAEVEKKLYPEPLSARYYSFTTDIGVVTWQVNLC